MTINGSDGQDRKGGTSQDYAQCFGFADEHDTSCVLRCALRKDCLRQRSEALPVCYGTYREGVVECTLCINASMCIDAQEKLEGTMPKIMLKRKTALVAAAPTPAPVVEEDVEVGEEAEVEIEETEVAAEEAETEVEAETVVVSDDDVKKHDYFGLEIPDLRVECQARKLDYTGSKMQLVRRLIEYDLTTEEPAPIAAPVAKPMIKQIAKPVVKPVIKQVAKPVMAAKPVVKPAVAAKPMVKQVLKPAAAKPVAAVRLTPAASKQVAELEIDFFTKLLDHLGEGKAVFITRVVGADPISYSVRMTDGDVSGKRAGKLPRGSTKAFEDAVFSEEFKQYAFVDSGTGLTNEDGTPKGWIQLSREEKREFATANSIEWEHADNDQMDMIRMSEAVRTAFGIEKYKPEYNTRQARDELKVEMGIK